MTQSAKITCQVLEHKCPCRAIDKLTIMPVCYPLSLTEMKNNISKVSTQLLFLYSNRIQALDKLPKCPAKDCASPDGHKGTHRKFPDHGRGSASFNLHSANLT